ncbi:uncharacterized protein LOC141720412 [Apium graveolens]|uniref:uncharacterized protein LOC141720412 n=1 Tax=Apium graveolens TaxID=4045 RepID=UPI003D796226
MSPVNLATSSSPHYESLPLTKHPNNPIDYDNDPNHDYTVLAYAIPIPYRLNSNGILFSLFTILFLTTSLYYLWPSNPELTIVRLKLNKFNAHAFPAKLDVELDLKVRVLNKDVYDLVYRSVTVEVVYRGSKLGFVEAKGGKVKAKGVSYVNATLRFDGIEVLEDAVFLIEDLARGVVTIDTVSAVEGKVGFVYVYIPIKAKVSCEVDINTSDHTIRRENCFSE